MAKIQPFVLIRVSCRNSFIECLFSLRCEMAFSEMKKLETFFISENGKILKSATEIEISENC